MSTWRLLHLTRRTHLYLGLFLLPWFLATAVAQQGHATIAEVLEHHPATQGLASVVGLLALAQDHAAPLQGVPEPVAWTGEGGTGRRATVPRHLFTREIT